MLIATSEWQKPQTSHIPACTSFLLVFDAIVARIPGYWLSSHLSRWIPAQNHIEFGLAKLGTISQSDTSSSQTSSTIPLTRDSWRLRRWISLPVRGSEFPVEFLCSCLCFPVRGKSLRPHFIPMNLMIGFGPTSDIVRVGPVIERISFRS
jgi:hypothetical protein